MTFRLTGDGVWSRMKYEAGPHRVQRVPVTESQGRMHTSSATVTVLPEADEVDVQIDPNDLQDRRLPVLGSRRAVGQHHRLGGADHPPAHGPRGVHAGREEPDPEPGQGHAGAAVPAAASSSRTGSPPSRPGPARARSAAAAAREKIRTYNFKENRVTDHRIGLTVYKLDKVLAGELDAISDALVTDDRARRLADAEA